MTVLCTISSLKCCLSAQRKQRRKKNLLLVLLSSTNPAENSMAARSLNGHDGSDRAQDNAKSGGEHGNINLSLQSRAGIVTHVLHGTAEHECRININKGIAKSSTTKRKDESEVRNLDG
mmetsp:Transcript_71/g.204  ORF Transcript_71/g.204 Transcript_71/m.204 type:complete len:119 (+) Transcript_71:144-500(+)